MCAARIFQQNGTHRTNWILSECLGMKLSTSFQFHFAFQSSFIQKNRKHSLSKCTQHVTNGIRWHACNLHMYRITQIQNILKKGRDRSDFIQVLYANANLWEYQCKYNAFHFNSIHLNFMDAIKWACNNHLQHNKTLKQWILCAFIQLK